MELELIEDFKIHDTDIKTNEFTLKKIYQKINDFIRDNNIDKAPIKLRNDIKEEVRQAQLKYKLFEYTPDNDKLKKGIDIFNKIYENLNELLSKDYVTPNDVTIINEGPIHNNNSTLMEFTNFENNKVDTIKFHDEYGQFLTDKIEKYENMYENNEHLKVLNDDITKIQEFMRDHKIMMYKVLSSDSLKLLLLSGSVAIIYGTIAGVVLYYIFRKDDEHKLYKFKI